MEAIRKPKSKTSVHSTYHPHLDQEEEVISVQGTVLPNVPWVEPGTQDPNDAIEESGDPLIEAREDCASPEPEELVFRQEEISSSTEYPDLTEITALDEDEGSETTAAPIYPALESLTDGVIDADEEPVPPATVKNQSNSDWSGLTQEYGKMDIREDLAPLYPNVCGETTELGLLSEEVLLTFYHNALYEDTEQLVDRFCVEELKPNGGPLRVLLLRLKRVCEDIDKATVGAASNESSLKESERSLWSMQPRMYEHVHTCDEHNRATGTVKYEIAVMDSGKLEEMKKLLEANRDVTLNKIMCLEIEARSITLQIQWLLNEVIQTFSIETNASPSAQPTLLPPASINAFPSYARGLFHSALSELFFFLRTPNLPERSLAAAKGWVAELTCFLHKSFLATDGLWLLCHLLRLPSPSSEWTAPLLQTFMQSSSSDKLKLDYSVAMISLLMSPIKSRELLLSDFSSHTVPDADEDQDPFVISESDLTSLLEQLPVAEFYTLAIRHFMAIHATTVDQFTSLIAFQLLLMKIFFVGLEEYSSMKYKAFCKQIGMALRKSVRELGCQWKAVRALLDPKADYQLQKEMDRILLLAVNYIVANKSLGLWQYLIDLPYDCISEECRLRVEYLLRKGGDEDCKSSRELFLMSSEEIAREMRASTIASRLEKAGLQDTVFLVQCLSVLVVQTSQDPTSFLKEVVQVCFVDEITRESLYKVGREAIATVLKAKPSCLESLITIIDRSIDHIEEHVMDIFASAPLHLCRISESVVGGTIGKWLIGRAPETPGNRVARKILSSLNWGYDENGGLWMSEGVHVMCADVVRKAHQAHCSGGIVATITNMAYGTVDHYERFEQFCWQLLVKLKLTIKASCKEPEADLVSHFLHATQHSLSSTAEFAESGLNYVNELLSAGCNIPAAVLLSRALTFNYGRTDAITGHANFLPVFERLLHADQGCFLRCAITYEASQVSDLSLYLRAWVNVLIVKRAAVFNTDQVSLHLLGTIALLAFEKDPTSFLGILDQLNTAQKQLISVWKESQKGFLSVFSSIPPPPLIPSSHLSISPWASVVCLQTEEATFKLFHDAFYEELTRESSSVEKALNKAASSTCYSLPLDRLPIYRLIQLCNACGFRQTEKEAERDEPVLVLTLQRLAQHILTPRERDGKKHQLSWKLFSAFKEQIKSFVQLLEIRRDNKGLPKAVAGWIRAADKISSPSFSDYSRLDLNHLLRAVIEEDKNSNVWMELVDKNILTSQSNEEYQFYASAIHGKGRVLSSTERQNNAYQRAPMRTRGSRALPFPALPDHSDTPRPPPLDRSSLGNARSATKRIQPLISGLSIHADKIEQTRKLVDEKDAQYLELLRQLHVPSKLNLDVVVRCSEICQGAAARSCRVNGTKFSEVTQAAKQLNRNERTVMIDSLKQDAVDDAGLQCATIELIARKITEIGIAPDSRAQYIVQNVGRCLFDLITASLVPVSSLQRFTPAITSFNQALKTLSKNPILASPDEQLTLLEQVLSGSLLASGLAAHFNPNVLPQKLFMEAHQRITQAAVKKELFDYVFTLMSKYSTSSFSSVSSDTIRALLSVLLINTTAVSSSTQKSANALRELFMHHFIDFVFLQFPVNIAYGLELVLKGCNRGTTTPTLFKKLVESLAKHSIDYQTCVDCIIITSQALKTDEQSLDKWHPYKDALEALMKLFSSQASHFHEDSQQKQVFNELKEVFARLSSTIN